MAIPAERSPREGLDLSKEPPRTEIASLASQFPVMRTCYKNAGAQDAPPSSLVGAAVIQRPQGKRVRIQQRILGPIRQS